MKRFTIIGILVMLCLAVLPFTAFGAEGAPSPTEAVQQYMDAVKSGNIEAAYALCAFAPNVKVPFDQFKKIADNPEALPADYPNRQEVFPLYYFVTDFNHKSGYQYKIKEAKPEDANTILVEGTSPDNKSTLIEIVTGKIGNGYGIDLEATGQRLEKRVKPADPRPKDETDCATNMKMLSLAILMYTQDHDEKYPDANKWVDEIMPYIKQSDKNTSNPKDVFNCPKVPTSIRWSYALNKNLAGKSLPSLNAPAETVLIFETGTGKKNQCDAGISLCKPSRHGRGNVYGYADGHVNIQKEKPSGTHSWKP